MKTLGAILTLLVWPVLACAFPSDAQVILQGDHFSAALSRQTGRLISIAERDHPNLLARPVVVSIRDGVSGKVQVLAARLEHLEANSSSATFSQQLPDLGVETTLFAGHDLSFEITLKNKTTERRDVGVWFDWGGLPRDCQAFLPGVYPHPERESTRELVYGYRAEGLSLVIPAATFFSHAARRALHGS